MKSQWTFSPFTSTFLQEVEDAVEKLRLTFGHDDNDVSEISFAIGGLGVALIWNEEMRAHERFVFNGEAWVEHGAWVNTR